MALRPFSLRDADAVFAYSSHPEWGRYQPIPSPYTLQNAERFVAELVLRDRDTQPSWAITLDDGVIGIVSITFHSDHRIAVLGYGVHRMHWGKGFSGEAARAIVDHSFRHYEQLKKIRAHTDSRNSGSIRVLQRLGFTHEGTLRSNQYGKGEFVDDVIHGILREEWTAQAFFEPDGAYSSDPVAAVIRCVECGSRTLLLNGNAIDAAFFDLSTGVAGQVVQKLVNYHVRMAAVVPDLSLHSASFRDFAREANAGRQFRFFATRQEAVDWLRSD